MLLKMEGAPSPMLSVVELALDDLQPHVAKTNKHLPTIAAPGFFANGPKAFIVTGLPHALFSSLQKSRCLVV